MNASRLGVLLLWMMATVGFAQTPPPADTPAAIALGKASGAGDLAQVQSLIDQGTPVDSLSGKYRNTPLICAADAGHLDVLSYLISKGAKLDFPASDGATALIYACYRDKTDCALKLIDAGANVNFNTNIGRSPLMYAASKGNDQVVQALIAHHADLDTTSPNSSPAVWWAVGHGNINTLKLLAKAGADLNPKRISAEEQKRRYNLFSIAAGKGDVELVDLFLAKGLDINSAGDDGISPLVGAALMGNSLTSAHLIDKGADVNHQDADGQTALMIGVNSLQPPDLQYLMDHGAKLEIKDKDQRTALIWAAYHVYEPSVRVLLEHGADVDATDAHGETALSYAGNRGATDIVQLLKEKGAKKTDVHIIAKDNPATPLTPAQTWALAVGAIYPQTNGTNPHVLGYEGSVSEVTKSLKAQWNITDKASFLKEIDELRASGRHADWKDAPVNTMSDADFAARLTTLASEDVAKMKAIRASFAKWKDHAGLAWDLCRAANLVSDGFQVHFLTEQEAWDLLLGIARQLQGSFNSWQEVSDNFLDGRESWYGSRDPRFEACAQLLLNPNDPNSPWTQNPWKTDLSATTTTVPAAPPAQ